jgi:hypothetical protein
MFVLRLMFPTLTHQVSLHALDVIEVCLRASMRVERMVHITAKGTMETSSGKLQPARPVVSVPTCPLPCVHQLSWFAGLLPWSGGTHLARAGQPVLSKVERMVHITAKGTMETSSGKLQPARPVVSVPTCPLPCVHQLS